MQTNASQKYTTPFGLHVSALSTEKLAVGCGPLVEALRRKLVHTRYSCGSRIRLGAPSPRSKAVFHTLVCQTAAACCRGTPWEEKRAAARCSTTAAFVWALQVHAQKRFSTSRSVSRLKNAAACCRRLLCEVKGLAAPRCSPSQLRVSVGESSPATKASQEILRSRFWSNECTSQCVS